MFRRVEGNANPGQTTDLPRPHTGTVDHIFRLDVAVFGGNSADLAIFLVNAGRLHILEYLGAAHFGTLGIGLGRIGWVCLPVAR